MWLPVFAGVLLAVGCGGGSGSPSTGGVTVGVTSGELVATPGSVGFGNVSIGSSATQTVALSNPGTGSTTISSVNTSGQGFSISGLATPLDLAAGQTITFNVTFAPTSGGPLTGDIRLANTTATSTVTIALSGTGATGVAPGGQLAATPANVTFTTPVVVGNSATQSVTLSNSGTGTTTVNSASITGLDFAFTLATPLDLPPGQTTSFNVVFNPTTGGALSATLNLYNTTAVSPLVINVSGTGTTVGPSPHYVDLAWTGSVSVVDGYNIYRGTVSGGPYAPVNSTLITGTTYRDSTVVAGMTYFYVATAKASGIESGYSNEAKAIIPIP